MKIGEYRAAFVHDHYFYSEEDKVYDASGGAFDPNLWKRYLKIFSSLKVIGRKANNAPNHFVLSSMDKVDFMLIDNLKRPFDRFLKKEEVSAKLEKQINTVDFTIIRLPSTLGYYAITICKKLNKPYILEVVGDPFDAYWNYGNLAGKIMAPIEAYKMRSATKASKATVYVTSHHLQQKYPTSGLQADISNVRLEKSSLNPAAPFHYEKEKDILHIGLIGSFLVKYKGHVEALKAIKKIVTVHKIHKIKLSLVGSGDSSWVKSLINKFNLNPYIEIIGTLNAGKEGIFPFLDSLDLLINTSHQEGLPRVVIEAMSRGRICLASNVGGTAELLDKEYIHKPGDWEQLTKHIIIINNLSPKAKMEISKTNLNKATSFLESTLQEKREKIIQSALKSV